MWRHGIGLVVGIREQVHLGYLLQGDDLPGAHGVETEEVNVVAKGFVLLVFCVDALYQFIETAEDGRLDGCHGAGFIQDDQVVYLFHVTGFCSPVKMGCGFAEYLQGVLV